MGLGAPSALPEPMDESRDSRRIPGAGLSRRRTTARLAAVGAAVALAGMCMPAVSQPLPPGPGQTGTSEDAPIAVPFYSSAIVRARESVLRSNLLTIRSVIDQYTYDKEEPPQSLRDLVDEGYLREVPMDPITNSRDTWELIIETGPTGESGLFDVRSGSDDDSLAGTPYNEW